MRLLLLLSLIAGCTTTPPSTIPQSPMLACRDLCDTGTVIQYKYCKCKIPDFGGK